MEISETTACTAPRDPSDKGAIQAAVDALPEEGGIVRVPAGEWLSGPIRLKSHVTLALERGCTVRFSQNFADYLPPVFTRWEGVECLNYSPLIYARGCTDVAVVGPGTLDGQGDAWWPWKAKQAHAAARLCRAEYEHIPVRGRVFGTESDALRPSFVQFIDCENVRFEGFTIRNGPQWTVHPVYCRNVTARGLTVETAGPNTDGFNPDSCDNVLIENCRFSTGDDCIAVNSGLNEDGWRVARPCTRVLVRNCEFLGGHAAVAVGSGMSGGVQDVTVRDCLIRGTERGIRVKSIRGRGGYVRDLRFEDLRIEDVQREAIEVSMNYGSSTAVPVSAAAPVFRDFLFRNITGSGAQRAVALVGLPESPLRGITLDGVSIAAAEPDVREYAELCEAGYCQELCANSFAELVEMKSSGNRGVL